VGIFLICIFVAHILYVLTRINWKELGGPDSLLPRPKDIKDFFQHVGWFLGIAKAPEFATGLLLAYPLTASKIMPGWGLNVALWIHRIEAILAMCHVFIIHFFIAHLRRHNFPMDRAMFEGSADLTATRHERPAWIARLKEAGELESKLVPEAPAGRRAIFYVFGYAAVVVGIFLLIGGLVNSPYITW
jgi:hypothetical protein